jgi:2-methylisocitrate lyase-like PEP mutase family enzyme
METLAQKAARFREMHYGPRILVLPNAWDAGSARVFEEAGCKALGTTSAGVAASMGLPDGERVERDEMLAAVRRITQAVSIPVTADLESGYGDSAEAVELSARGAILAGAVGLNLEDARGGALLDIELSVARVRAARRVADELGVPLVINGRTDVYLLAVGPPESRFDEAVRRANAYRDAGADCLFVPGALDAETIGRLVSAIHGPLNVLALKGVPGGAELERLGVARVSTGSGPMRATLSLTRRIAEDLQRGEFGAFTDGIITHAEVNRLMGA